MKRIVIALVATCCLIPAISCAQQTPAAHEMPANHWVCQENALIGPDRPVAVVWSPPVKRFMSLGWISSAYSGRAPYTYDELAFDPEKGQWENWYPVGKDWGPKFGICKPPGWELHALISAVLFALAERSCRLGNHLLGGAWGEFRLLA